MIQATKKTKEKTYKAIWHSSSLKNVEHAGSSAEWDFQSITDDTSFYLNQNGEVVICFNEGDVAPMYMGCVEFVIPNEVLADIRK